MWLAWRRPVIVASHAGLFLVSYRLAFELRFDFDIPGPFDEWRYLAWAVPLIVLRLGAYSWYGMFHGMWKYTGQRDLESLAKATLGSTLAFALVVLAVGPSFPRSVFLVEWMIALGLAAGLRLGVRSFASAARRIESDATARRLLVIGAGDAGEMLLREIHRNMPGVRPVGLLDDNPSKRGMTLHGVSVLGAVEDAPRFLEELGVTDVVIAIPTASGKEMRRIVTLVSRDRVAVRTVPALEHLIDGRVTFNQIREVAIDDLLGREAVTLEQQAISGMIRNNVVLVTGAGGSIGSELCRQIARFHPRTLVLVEQAENALFHIHREITRSFPDIDVVPRIVDITDAERVDAVFAEFVPGLVLHAAAHKHVPMMEWNPGEAVKNNVFGTRNVVDAADRHGVRRMVMISTDKAVNPTSVMGCTKRVAELYIQAKAEVSETVFVTVRFGNVLGSNGSVIPLFKEQIAAGGPVTVTHPDMVRYFMTIPEASQLVLQAGSMGTSGEIYVLDMGEPVRIVQLAEDLIRLSGLRPHLDIEIAFTGARPGEKLFEELSTAAEAATKTHHPKIFVGRGARTPIAVLERELEVLRAVAHAPAGDVRSALGRLVPEYRAPAEAAPASNVVSLVPAVK
jgi:FlaA1/EpsC-like NDP-sugar epimerase